MTVDCRVRLEAGVRVYDVESADAATSIAIATVGEALTPAIDGVEIAPAERRAPGSGEVLPPAFHVADEALVALSIEVPVRGVEGPAHARRVARSEVGRRLEDVPLSVESVTVEDADELDEGPGSDDGDAVAV